MKETFPETFKSQEEENKNVIHRPRSVHIERNCALGLSTALALRPRAILKTSGTVSPNTDLPAVEWHIYICHGNSENSDGCSYLLRICFIYGTNVSVSRSWIPLQVADREQGAFWFTKKRVQIKILSILKLVSFKSLTGNDLSERGTLAEVQCERNLTVGDSGEAPAGPAPPPLIFGPKTFFGRRPPPPISRSGSDTASIANCEVLDEKYHNSLFKEFL